MRHDIQIRLTGLKGQYYILRVFFKDGRTPIVHTSKKLDYLYKLIKERYSK